MSQGKDQQGRRNQKRRFTLQGENNRNRGEGDTAEVGATSDIPENPLS